MDIMQSGFSSKPFTLTCRSSTKPQGAYPNSVNMIMKLSTVDESMGLMQMGQHSNKIFIKGMAGLSRFSLSADPSKFSMITKVNADWSRMSATANASFAAPLEPSFGSSFIIRPLAEILRDLNKKVPDQVLQGKPGSTHQKHIPWYQANRMLSFYAPGWCGEVRDITFSADGKFVTVIYRVTIRGSDGEAFREASGTVFTANAKDEDPTQQAEQMAFVRACARFGLGLYLHHEQ